MVVIRLSGTDVVVWVPPPRTVFTVDKVTSTSTLFVGRGVLSEDCRLPVTSFGGKGGVVPNFDVCPGKKPPGLVGSVFTSGVPLRIGW